jgi:branched-chain amino acid transport system permease protein
LDYLLSCVTHVIIFSIAAVSLNLVCGLTGIMTLTHAGFMAVGAYTTAILATRYGVNFFLTIVVAIVICMIISAIIGIPSLRIKGDVYLAATIALQIVMIDAICNMPTVTGGFLGLTRVPRPEILGLSFRSQPLFLILSILFLIGICWYVRRVSNSPLGRALRATRDDEDSAQALGKQTTRLRIISFVVAAGIAGIAGCLFATYAFFVHPSSFVLHQSILLVVMILIGGYGSIPGAILGAAIIVGLPHLVRVLPSLAIIGGHGPAVEDMVFGVLILLFVFFRPKGLLPERIGRRSS